MALADVGCEVLVVGRYFVDLVLGGLPAPATPGREVFAERFDLCPGGAFTLAMGLHRLGHDVLWSVDFGNDVFSREVLELARRERLNETFFRFHDIPLRAVTVAVSDSSDRAMISYVDRVRPPALSDVVRICRPRMVMLPLLEYDDATRAGLRTVREMGGGVFMDCQDVTGTLADRRLRDTLSLVDVFAPNATEAMGLTGASTVDDALRTLADVVDTVIVTCGPEGARAARGGRRYEVAGIAVDAVDTTGAGDCFDVGFIHGHLSGRSLSDCLAIGVACGAAAVTGPGSSAALHLSELPRWLCRVPGRQPAGDARPNAVIGKER